MHRRSVRLLTFVATLSFAACGESTDLVDQLSNSEAQELAGAIMMATFNSMPETQAPAAAGPAATAVSYSAEVDATGECAEGGTVDVHATVSVTGDTESTAGTVTYSMTETHHGCMATSPNGVTFTLDGAPNVGVDVMAESDGLGALTYSGTIEGAVDWATEGRHGTCSIALELSGSLNTSGDQPTGQFGVGGTVCQVSVQESASIG